jgi:hypothetical protein
VYVVTAQSFKDLATKTARTLNGAAQIPQSIATQSSAAPSATNISIDDVDANGFSDLVVTNFALQRAAGNEAVGSKTDSSNQLNIVWGNRDGFSSEPTKLPVSSATSTAIGDLNRDGKLDVAV